MVAKSPSTYFAQLPDSQHPLLVKYKKAQEKFVPKERWGVFFYAGFGFVETMVEGLKRCGRDLTVENFVAAMESIKDFQGIGGKISFGPNQRQGIRSCFLVRCTEGGRIEHLSDWMTSDLDVEEMTRTLWK